MHIVIGLLVLIVLLLIFGPVIIAIIGGLVVALVAAVIWLVSEAWPYLLAGVGIAIVVGIFALFSTPSAPRRSNRASERRLKGRQAYSEAMERGLAESRPADPETAPRAHRDRATIDALLRKHREGKYKPPAP